MRKMFVASLALSCVLVACVTCTISVMYDIQWVPLEDTLPPPELFAFATMATSPTFFELRLFLHSLRTFHPTASVYVLATEPLAALVRTQYLNVYPEHDVRLDVSLDPNLEVASREGRKKMAATKKWAPLMLAKMRALNTALANRTQSQVEAGVGVWLLDCDVTLLRPIPEAHIPPPEADVGLSRHHMHPYIEDKYGKYNGGYMYVRNTTFGPWWLEETTAHQNKYYFEQGTLAVAASVGGYRVHQLPITHNFGWWRYQFPHHPPYNRTNDIVRLFNGTDDGVYFDNRPLISSHVHWTDPNHNRFINVIESRLRDSSPLVGWLKELRAENRTHVA